MPSVARQAPSRVAVASWEGFRLSGKSLLMQGRRPGQLLACVGAHPPDPGGSHYIFAQRNWPVDGRHRETRLSTDDTAPSQPAQLQACECLNAHLITDVGLVKVEMGVWISNDDRQGCRHSCRFTWGMWATPSSATTSTA